MKTTYLTTDALYKSFTQQSYPSAWQSLFSMHCLQVLEECWNKTMLHWSDLWVKETGLHHPLAQSMFWPCIDTTSVITSVLQYTRSCTSYWKFCKTYHSSVHWKSDCLSRCYTCIKSHPGTPFNKWPASHVLQKRLLLIR